MPIVIAVVILLALLAAGASLYTDLLWFREVGFSDVFTTTLRTKLLLFVVFGTAMAAIVGANIVIAHRLRPPFRPTSLEQQNLDRYRVATEPYLLVIVIAVSALIGLLAGVNATGSWRTWLAWRNQVSFGVKDPQFGRDIAYFAFTYPFQRVVLNVLFGALITSVVASAVTHYLFGGIRIQTAGEKVTAPARAHLSVLFGILVLLKGAAYYLDQFGLAFSSRGVVTGASYTDVKAELPALRILMVIALICAGLFIYNLRSRGWALPAIGIGLLVLSSLVIGGIYPAFIQRIRVRPNEIAREAPYIQRNIDATRRAYGIDGAEYQPYQARTSLTAAQLRADKDTIPHARLLDPNHLQPTFEQLQQIRAYYGFTSTLDIDRYTVKGETQDYIVAARELDQRALQADQRNFINERLTYTHGYGFVAAPANTADTFGAPSFSIRDIPTKTPITLTREPRIYYGELSPSYSVVGTDQPEIDRPSESNESQPSTNTYDGKGGVDIGGRLRRLLYAVKFREPNLMLSSSLTDRSKILYNRNPRDRVAKVAPFLQLDQDPYPAIVDGKILWIVDGYTTTDGYPYAELKEFGAVTRDSRGGTLQGRINYIRNSVKATVDSYDGTVTLYAWDDVDPVLKTWAKAFGSTLRPKSEMPKELVEHLRYPEDLFKVQRDLISQYHVAEARAFYTKEDFWGVPDDPNAARAGIPQPPFYLLLRVPGQDKASFDLTTVLVARNRPNLAAYVSVSSDQADYGKIRILQLPRDVNIPGPGQVASAIESKPEVSQSLSLLRGGGSNVILGNLLTLPVGGGLLYIEPVYVQASGGESYPLLRKVVVSFGDKIGYADTLALALDQVFGEGAAPPTTGGPTTPPTTGGSDELRLALAAAQQAYADGQAALAKGDFAAYGAAQARLKAALDRAQRASQGSTPSASPTPAASPSA